jgi:hypothetical protein
VRQAFGAPLGYVGSMDDIDDSDEDRSLFGYSTGRGPLADFGELGERRRAATIEFRVESPDGPEPNEDL